MTWARVVAWVVAHRIASWIGGGALLSAIALGGFTFCRRPDNPVPPREQRSTDSLKATKPAFDSSQRSSIKRADSTITKIVVDSAPIAAARREAARWRRTADSLAILARARDAAPRGEVPLVGDASPDTSWKAVADAYKHEADSLRVVDAIEKSDLADARRTITDLRASTVAGVARVEASEAPKTGLNDRLTRDVQRASECSILGVFRCPPRKVVFVGGVVTTVAVGAAIKYRKELGIP